ncbi:hypothetical protein [Candidatus Magnetomonas plexicatena]
MKGFYPQITQMYADERIETTSANALEKIEKKAAKDFSVARQNF